jgi:hypothetical protein
MAFSVPEAMIFISSYFYKKSSLASIKKMLSGCKQFVKNDAMTGGSNPISFARPRRYTSSSE